MLPLIRVRDTIDVVCTTDPSVKAKAEDRQIPTWREASKARHSSDALVITVRPLSSSEMLRCHGFLLDGRDGQAELTVHAARAGAIKASGPGIDCQDEDAVHALIDRLQPGELAALGGYVLEQSLMVEDDPTNGTG